MRETHTRPAPGPLARLGSTLGRQTALYASASIGTFVFAIANIAVLTRFLSLDEFGHLSLYLFFATLLTVVYNLGSLQGTFMAVFGRSAGGEEGGDVELEGDAHDVSDTRRALGTGIVLTVLVGAAGTALVAVASRPLTTVLLGSSSGVTDTILAGACGATGAVWRLVLNVLRFERRPWMFTAMTMIRPALVFGATSGLVALGHGVTGALTGTALANTASVAFGLLAARRSYVLTFQRRVARLVLRTGAYTIPIIVAVWIVHNVDLYLISLFSDDSAVAQYRVASRIGAGMSYFVSAFLMAWSPLANTPMYAAAQREHGRATAGAVLITYFLFACAWVTLGLAVLADGLIRIAPASYEPAARLIPVVALGYVAFGLFNAVYRMARFDRKTRRFAQLAVLAAVLFLGSSLLLIPLLGAYGAPGSQIVAFGTVAAITLWLSQRGPEPLAFDGRRLAVGAGVVAVCFAISQTVGPHLGPSRVFLDIGVLALFPLLLVATGTLPREHLGSAAAVVRLSRRRAVDLGVRADGRTIDLLVRERRSVGEAAALLGTTADVVMAEALGALRELAGVSRATDADVDIGTYLFARQSTADRDRLARRLWSEGVDPLEVEALELVVERLRRRPMRVR